MPGGWPPPSGRAGRGAGAGGGGRRPLLIGLGVLAAVAVVAVVAVVATGDDDGGSSGGPPAGVTLADLEPALLTESDVGGDFRLDESGGDESDGDDDPDDPANSEQIEASEECRLAFERFDWPTGPGREQIAVEFENAADGSIDHSLSLARSGDPSLAEVRAAVDQCDEAIRITEDGTSGEVHIVTSDVDGIGDSAFGLTLEFEVQAAGATLAFEINGVLWERDGVHASVGGFGGFDPTAPDAQSIDAARIEELARLSDQRLADILDG